VLDSSTIHVVQQAAEMATKTSTFREAERLAKFLCLKPNQVDRFRQAYPRFAPAKWWSYQPTNPSRTQWQLVQEFLREAWDDGFELDLFELTRLLLCVFDPPDTNEAFVSIHAGRERPAFAGLKEIADDWGYHIGVRYLAEHPWAAKVCEECPRPYVADIPARKYCFEMGDDGLRCSERVSRRTHLKNWYEKGDKQRKERRRSERNAANKKTAR